MAGEPDRKLEIPLPRELRAFVEAQAAQEGFASGSEYVQDLVRRARARSEGYDEDLERLLLEGLDSGPPIEMTPEYWEKKRALIQRIRGKAAE